MNIRLKKQNNDGIMRLETSGAVKEILINEDFLNPSDESISLCFRGKNTSGIIDLTPEEIEKLYSSVKTKLHLVKGIKRYNFK